VPGLAAGARDDVAGGRGHAAVPGAAAGGRPPGLRGAHGDRAAVRRLRPGRRGRAGQAHRGAGGRPHRRAPVPARTDPARPQRPVLGMRLAATHAGTAALLLSLLTGAWAPQLSAGEAVLHPFHAAQPASTPAEALLAVEIPAGSATKYEIGADGLVYVDRFVSMPVAYPANYGSIPRSLAGDGDPLDALVLTRAPLHPGVLVRFRPVGVLRMRDDGEQDDKIIGVPVDTLDPGYAEVRDIGDLPAAERARIEAFFRVYKDLPQGRNAVVLDGFGDAAEAKILV